MESIQDHGDGTERSGTDQIYGIQYHGKSEGGDFRPYKNSCNRRQHHQYIIDHRQVQQRHKRQHPACHKPNRADEHEGLQELFPAVEHEIGGSHPPCQGCKHDTADKNTGVQRFKSFGHFFGNIHMYKPEQAYTEEYPQKTKAELLMPLKKIVCQKNQRRDQHVKENP